MELTRHRLAGSLAELRAQMDRAAVEDDQAEAGILAARKRGCLGFAALGASLGVPSMLSSGLGSFSSIVTLVFGLPLIAWGIWTLVVTNRQMKQARRHDLNDQQVETVRMVLRLLAADVPPKAGMKLEVDFRASTQGEFVDPATSPGKQVWRQPWLVLEGRFADRTKWKLTVERRQSQRRKPKNSGREKVIDRHRDRLVVDIEVDPQRYADLRTLPQRTPPPPAPLQVLQGTAQGNRARAVLATPEARCVTVRGTTTWTGQELLAGPEVILSSLVWLYRGLSTHAVPRS